MRIDIIKTRSHFIIKLYIDCLTQSAKETALGIAASYPIISSFNDIIVAIEDCFCNLVDVVVKINSWQPAQHDWVHAWAVGWLTQEGGEVPEGRGCPLLRSHRRVEEAVVAEQDLAIKCEVIVPEIQSRQGPHRQWAYQWDQFPKIGKDINP